MRVALAGWDLLAGFGSQPLGYQLSTGTQPARRGFGSPKSHTAATFHLRNRRCTRLLGTLLTREELDAFPTQLAAAMAGKCCCLLQPVVGSGISSAGVRRSGWKLCAPALWLLDLLSQIAQPPTIILQNPPTQTHTDRFSNPPTTQFQADLADHLQRLRHQGRKAAEAAAADEQAPPLLVQLAAVAIYAAHASAVPAASGSGQPPSFAAAVQQQRVRSLSVLLLFTLTSKLAAAAAAAAETAPGGLQGSAAGLLLLPPLRVLLLWLSRAGPDVLLPPQQAQQGPADVAAARQQLWQASAALVAALRSQQEASAAALATGDAQQAQLAQQGSALLLPEDAQLAGFTPLDRAEASSVGTSGGSGTASSLASTVMRRREVASGEAAASERVLRVLRDAAAIARVLAEHREPQVPAGLAAAQAAFVQAALPGTQVGQQQQVERQANEQRQRPERQQPPPPPPPPPPQQQQQGSEQQQQHQQQVKEKQQGAQPMEEDELIEEEVILYAPPPRPARSPAPAAAPAAAAAQQARHAQQEQAQRAQQQQQVGVQPPTRGSAAVPAAAAGAPPLHAPMMAPPPAAAAAAAAALAEAPQEAATFAAAGPIGMDLETEEALMAQTVEVGGKQACLVGSQRRGPAARLWAGQAS